MIISLMTFVLVFLGLTVGLYIISIAILAIGVYILLKIIGEW